MIKSVKGLAIGDEFFHDGWKFKVTQFPTRYSVCGQRQHSRSDGGPFACKVPVSEVRKVKKHEAEHHNV